MTGEDARDAFVRRVETIGSADDVCVLRKAWMDACYAARR